MESARCSADGGDALRKTPQASVAAMFEECNATAQRTHPGGPFF
jgi:hypothetical protein